MHVQKEYAAKDALVRIHILRASRIVRKTQKLNILNSVFCLLLLFFF
jgi:hypothetical protein